MFWQNSMSWMEWGNFLTFLFLCEADTGVLQVGILMEFKKLGWVNFLAFMFLFDHVTGCYIPASFLQLYTVCGWLYCIWIGISWTEATDILVVAVGRLNYILYTYCTCTITFSNCEWFEYFTKVLCVRIVQWLVCSCDLTRSKMCNGFYFYSI